MVLLQAIPAWGASVKEQIAAVKAEKNEAIFRVEDIVNQPVTHLKRTPGMDVDVYYSGWFHPGAITPDFDHVDIRKTQDLSYQGHKYVTSNLNPGEVFLGSELEFNSMTKYFYTTRNVPKKKLTEAEMLEINQLYRTIGRCNHELYALEHPEPAWIRLQRQATNHKPVVAGIVGFLLVALVLVRRAKTKQIEE